MWIDANPLQAQAILQAMGQVATVGGRRSLSDTCRRALVSASRVVFQLPGEPTRDALLPISPEELAAALPDRTLAEWATRFLTVMSLVDGSLDQGKVALVSAYAESLGVREEYLTQLSQGARGNLEWIRADMTRQNIKSLWDQPWDGRDVMEIFLPYRGNAADPSLAARYRALETLAQGTFGRALYDLYIRNRYAFPGEEQGLNERFGMPHDSTHVLSGYDTSPQGEILVSTFTAGMHPRLPMEGHILPVIFSWHVGIEINALAGSTTGRLDPEKFWVAWVRGSAMPVDLFRGDWNVWEIADEPVEAVRERYCVPPLAPEYAATP